MGPNFGRSVFRSYRRLSLQLKEYFTAFFEIHKIDTLLHRSTLNFFERKCLLAFLVVSAGCSLLARRTYHFSDRIVAGRQAVHIVTATIGAMLYTTFLVFAQGFPHSFHEDE